MAYKIVFSDKAQKEIQSSWEWYEDRQLGLGDRFVVELMHKVDIIEENPELFSIRHKNYREAVLTVFPLVIIYRINKKKLQVKIVAVFHSSRNSKAKYRG